MYFRHLPEIFYQNDKKQGNKFDLIPIYPVEIELKVMSSAWKISTRKIVNRRNIFN